MMIPYVRHPWGPFTIETQITQEFADMLLEKGNESRQKNLNYSKTLAGQMDHEYYYEDTNYKYWFCPFFDLYINSYRTGIFEENLRFFHRQIVDYEVMSLWINYQQPTEYNPPHNHGGDISFVIYLQVPEEIVIENEKTKHEHNNPGPGMICFDLGPEMPFSVTRIAKMPQVRDIFIFPAWLPHHVNAFKSNVERISVSGNLRFIEKSEEE